MYLNISNLILNTHGFLIHFLQNTHGSKSVAEEFIVVRRKSYEQWTDVKIK